MDLDFSRMNGASFERIVAALCLQEINLNGSVFPAGPDGGRDFCHDGNAEKLGWNGYIVVQAKFRESEGGRKSDADWIIGKIKEEFEKFSTRHIRMPDYYIVATNISLSGADDIILRNGKKTTGGLTKVERELGTLAKNAGMKGWAIWPKTKISDLLASQPTIRQSYSAWLTPGDVIEKVLNEMSQKPANFDAILRRSLRKSLRRDKYARLKDAGDINESQIQTNQVFVDLPVWTSASGAVDNILEDNRLVREIISRAKDRLTYDPSFEQKSVRDEPCPSRSKIVILGGPGQGKSTASLFAVQIFRATILSDSKEAQTDLPTAQLCAEILESAKLQKISTNIVRRYPHFVSLPKFADELTVAADEKRNPPSLLKYIASELSKLSESSVSIEDIRNWLRIYPWLIVLDGLDEVPPSGERVNILEAITTLDEEIRDSHGDALVIVTTRPQGFTDDLSHKYWEHWTLSDLSTDDALAYGHALGTARYPDDENRRTDLDRKLKEAANRPATARLMISPLQVTIMHMIVDTGGGVPTARWSLFNEYFDVLRKREKSKGGESQRMLEQNWSHLAPIHQRVGLVLQTDSERSGSAHSFLTKERFKSLVFAYFKSIGEEGDETEARCEQIVDFALHRLVLLSARDEGQITFDVRSMQEYMAAGALTSGTPANIESRLLHIAPAAHWRNVWLIAASRCFAEDGFHHLRLAISGIPRQIELSGLDSIAKTGAKLSLDLFMDGIGLDHPLSRKILAKHSLEILNARGVDFDRRLLTLKQPACEKIILDYLGEKLDPERPGITAAWAYAFRLASLHEGIFQEVIESSWPSTAEGVIKLIPFISLPIKSEFVRRGVFEAIKSVDPFSCATILSNFHQKLSEYLQGDRTVHRRRTDHDKLLEATQFWSITGREARFPVAIKDSPVKFRIRQPFENQEIFCWLSETTLHRGWEVAMLAEKYAAQPTYANLREAINKVAAEGTLKTRALRAAHLAPWPLSACWAILETVSDSKKIEVLLKEQGLSQQKGRADILNTWRRNGVSLDEVLATSLLTPGDILQNLLTTPLIGSRLNVAARESDDVNCFIKIARAALQSKSGIIRQRLTHLASFSTVGSTNLAIPNFPELSPFLRLKELKGFCYLDFLASMSEEVWDSDECVASLAALSMNMPWIRSTKQLNASLVFRAIKKSPTERGLITTLLLAFSSGSAVSKDELTSIRSILTPTPADEGITVLSCRMLEALLQQKPEKLPRTILDDVKSKELLVHCIKALKDEFSYSAMEHFSSFLLSARAGSYDDAEVETLKICDQEMAKRQTELPDKSVWIGRLSLWEDAYPILRTSLAKPPEAANP